MTVPLAPSWEALPPALWTRVREGILARFTATHQEGEQAFEVREARKRESPASRAAVLGVITEALSEAERAPSRLAAAVRVRSVAPGSAAAKAGVQPGDWLVTLEGRAVTDPSAVRLLVQSFAVGARVKLELRRKGIPLTVWATLGGN